MFPWLSLSIVHQELIQNISDSVGVAETVNVRSEFVHTTTPELAMGEIFRTEGILDNGASHLFLSTGQVPQQVHGFSELKSSAIVT
jgi:hypothetical protein